MTQTVEESFCQEKRGRPGQATRYRRQTRERFALKFAVNADAVSYDAKLDGYFPLVSNDRELSAAEALKAYRYQPNLETRHHLLKSIQDATPVLLKSPERIGPSSAATSSRCCAAASSSASCAGRWHASRSASYRCFPSNAVPGTDRFAHARALLGAHSASPLPGQPAPEGLHPEAHPAAGTGARTAERPGDRLHRLIKTAQVGADIRLEKCGTPDGHAGRRSIDRRHRDGRRSGLGANASLIPIAGATPAIFNSPPAPLGFVRPNRIVAVGLIR